MFIRGYCDRPNVAPGETVSFFVATDRPADYTAELVRLVCRPEGSTDGQSRHTDGTHADRIDTERVDLDLGAPRRGFPQRTQVGGYVEVPDPDAALAGVQGGFTLHAFIWSTTPQKRQSVLSRWDESARAGWALTIDDGFLTLTVSGPDGQSASVRSDRRLFPEVFYSVVAGLDTATGELFVEQRVRLNRTNSRLGHVVPLDSDTTVDVRTEVRPLPAAAPVVIAGLTAEVVDGRAWVSDTFNGKIDSPKVLVGGLSEDARTALHDGRAPVGDALLAQWDFSREITAHGIASDDVTDVSGNGRDGRCVNQPDRAMTGWNWDGFEENYRHAPEQYGAIWFHDDSLDDCRWTDPIEVQIPQATRSGAYALVVRSGDHEDQIPFFVVAPRGATSAKVAVLLPTFSYLAYGNSQDMQSVPSGQAIMGVFTSLEDRDLELTENPGPYGLSTYDYHADGRGVQYSSWRRPLLSMRPRYRHEFGSVWQFPADLQLLGWLEASGIDYDVITDHDLHAGGLPLLQGYKVVLTGTHPEYYSSPMMDAWEDYLATGGRGMYLAGDGFYWVASRHPHKPWMIEVRKGETGAQAWRARPGEYHHEFSPERGGLWRMRARAPQKTWGTGFGSYGLDVSAGYVQLPDARDPRVDWIFDGVEEDEVIGDFGLVNGGAAGLELDVFDLTLGTPPHALLLASSQGHSVNAVLVPEEHYFTHAGMNGVEHPGVRADLVFFTTRAGGAVFSASSMTWCGSLLSDGGDNNVSRITGNVLRRFMADAPIDEIV
ncbi:N,N-dimethylformamidase beta subunit family domain-containing protein [Pseudonocardia xishanensis]|uniref:N,N-dimethylformamidase beta subunit family domain-containing protein n=1 Tax=Pseudonocardia xishanensis TaxID=630995 RepID=UPI0031EB2146